MWGGISVDFTCIFLVISDIEHLFMSLTICISSWRNVYSRPFPIFELGFCCWVMGALCIFWILILYQIYNWQIVSLSLWVVFHPLDSVLWYIDVLNLMRSNLLILSYIADAFGIISKKSLTAYFLKSLTAYFLK